MRTLRAALPLLLCSSVLGGGLPAHAALPDVPEGYWAREAITYVAESRDWMQDHPGEFRPEEQLQRRHLARAAIRAFAPGEAPGPTFSDVPPDDPFFPSASAAVKLGWMTAADGAFRPGDPVTKVDLDRALVWALGLEAEIQGLSAIRTEDGRPLPAPSGFAVLVLAHQLRLHHNHGTKSEVRELWPASPVRRADAAFALHRAATTSSWRLAALSRYRTVVLPAMGERKREAAGFALGYVGSPYVYAGEWHRPTSPGYCCGAQAQGGFDCSGFVWWVVRKGDRSWSNRAVRPYVGWVLPQRSSREMAKATKRRRGFAKSKPLDVMFFDGDASGGGWKGVDHAGLYLGNGWMIHSASGIDGVSIEWAADGWYRDHFKWSRRLRRR